MRSVREEHVFPVYPQHQTAAPMMPTVHMLAAATGGRYSAFDEPSSRKRDAKASARRIGDSRAEARAGADQARTVNGVRDRSKYSVQREHCVTRSSAWRRRRPRRRDFGCQLRLI
jgi:hypothetical protein